MQNHKAIIEVLKSAGRFVWFGLLGVVATALTALAATPEVVTATVTVAGFEVSVGVIIVTVIGLGVKAIDVYVHRNKNIDSNGLAPSFLQK